MLGFTKNSYSLIKNKLKLFPSDIIVIHIGKCGGSTVRSELINNEFKFSERHIRKIRFQKNKKYVIVIRNPISRFVSAFNWRYKLVVKDGNQRNRFKGEFATLKKYKTCNNLAENIYNSKGELQIDLSKKHYYIHHIKEDINFYIGDFLDKCKKENIIAVIATETLNEDMLNYFSIEVQKHEKKNKKDSEDNLSNLATTNLKKYLIKDYRCIQKIYDMNLISEQKYKLLSK